MNHTELNRPRCYAKSPTAQDAFQPIPGLISCAGVTGNGDCHIMHKMQSEVSRDSENLESTVSLSNCSSCSCMRVYVCVCMVCACMVLVYMCVHAWCMCVCVIHLTQYTCTHTYSHKTPNMNLYTCTSSVFLNNCLAPGQFDMNT